MPRQKQKRISIPTLSQASERKFKEATARGILARATLRCRDRTCSLDLHDFQLWQFVSTVSFCQFARFGRFCSRVRRSPVNLDRRAVIVTSFESHFTTLRFGEPQKEGERSQSLKRQ